MLRVLFLLSVTIFIMSSWVERKGRMVVPKLGRNCFALGLTLGVEFYPFADGYSHRGAKMRVYRQLNGHTSPCCALTSVVSCECKL